MTSLLLVASAWTVLAAPFGLLLGLAMRMADRRDAARHAHSAVPDFIPADVFDPVAAQDRRFG